MALLHQSDFNVYKLIHDPVGDWGNDTRLSRRDITRLIQQDSIEIGCKFMDVRNGKTFEIVHKKKGTPERTDI
jgi:hypothetical protein